jgi:hypothetical protein
MKENSTNYPTLKEMEQIVWRELQETFSSVMGSLLEDLDKQIAEERDKQRYHLKDNRSFSMDSLFGEINENRSYYRDRKTGEYVYLLD